MSKTASILSMWSVNMSTSGKRAPRIWLPARSTRRQSLPLRSIATASSITVSGATRAAIFGLLSLVTSGGAAGLLGVSGIGQYLIGGLGGGTSSGSDAGIGSAPAPSMTLNFNSPITDRNYVEQIVIPQLIKVQRLGG